MLFVRGCRTGWCYSFSAAVDQTLDLPANASRADVMKAMDIHVVGKAAYVGLYQQAAAQ